MIRLRNAVLPGLLCAVLCLLDGCGPAATPPADGGTPTAQPAVAAGTPEPGDWLIERLEGEPAALSPYIEGSRDAYVVHIVDPNIYQSMIRRNFETLEFEPLLAESWEISEDHLTYTFRLRKDVKFSDGVPMTALDVKFTIDAILNPANDTGSSRSYFTDLESVELPDDHTIVLHCKKPYFGHLEVFGSNVLVLPKHVFETGDFNTHPANRAPVGTGPYKLASWTSGMQMELERNDLYWGTKPYLDKLVYKFVPEDIPAFNLLQQQQVDMMRVRSPEQWLQQGSQPSFTDKFNKFEVYSPVDGYLGTFTWIGWNMRRPQLQDKRVRQALTMLLDRQTILEKIFLNMGRVVTGESFPDSPDYDKTIAPWPYDPARAEQLLAEAGWVDSNSNGTRDKDGMELALTWLYPNGSPEYDRLATVFVESMKKAGITATLRPLEWATFQESVTKRDFDACMMSWASPAESDPYQIWHSSQAEGGSNYVGFVNPEADKLMEDGRLEFDREKRAVLYRRLHAILHEEQPYTFLYNRKRLLAVDKRFQNVEPYPLGFTVDEWFVPQALQRY